MKDCEEKYGLSYRFVQEKDAEFILRLRTDEKLSRYVHPTPNDIELQREYIKKYKQKEAEGKEYYFIFFYQDNPAGVARVYHVEENSFTFGSWLFIQNLPYWIPIAGAIIAREFAFETLGKSLELEVDGMHEQNKGVISFSKLLGMTINGEKMEEKGRYLTGELRRDDFITNKQKVIRTFPK